MTGSTDYTKYAIELSRRARAASLKLAAIEPGVKNRWLMNLAQVIRQGTNELQTANERDLLAAPEFGLNAAATDRLRLTDDRIGALAAAVEEIALLPDPVGEILDGHTRPNGLRVRRVRVPLGVVFFIYESRPNVTIDAAALCIKSGNAVILRGGKEAFHSNLALHGLITRTLEAAGLPVDAAVMVDRTDRAIVGALLERRESIDVTIPRGGRSLIERVASEAQMPVIKHFDGNCHIYIDASADPEMARQIVVNAKTSRPGVCNAVETLLVHQEAATSQLAELAAVLMEKGVELRGCERSRRIVPAMKAATQDDWSTEFLDLVLAVRVVDTLDEGIEHINQYGSRHSDAVVTEDIAVADRFCTLVDSAAVLVNASTRFNDGGELGLGAEIGISTDKVHARGPCGLRELTSYKWIVSGAGHIRE